VKAEVQKHLWRAEQCIRVADDLVRLGHWPETVSRSYYAMFHAATAVLLELGIERSSHHGVWAAFGQFVAAKGMMDVHYHHLATEWFRARGDSDYFAEPDDTRDDAMNGVAAARDFVAACRAFLEGPEGGQQP
jgi:uncharacterized protein (UPF0332 family)